MGEVDGFPVGALGRETCDAGFGQADGVAGNRCRVEVFGDGVEEADGGDVDARGQRAVGVILSIERCAAV